MSFIVIHDGNMGNIRNGFIATLIMKSTLEIIRLFCVIMVNNQTYESLLIS